MFSNSKTVVSKKSLRIITPDVKIAEELGKFAEIETIIVGGILRPGYYSIGGDLAIEIIDKFSVEKAFLGVDAIDLEKGITNASMFEVGIKKAIIKSAKQVIVLSDYTKFGKIALAEVAPMHKIDYIITDSGISKEFIEGIEKFNINLIIT